MAAVADVQLVNITINDIPLQVPKGELIVESVKRVGLEIPIFCYHPRMKPVGMCRMCLIEIGTKGPDGSVRMMPKPQAACSLPASEGLVVVTDSDKIHADRRGVLEFMLINHPLDCPICDRGGECPLQNNTLFYGPSTSRFVEMKRHAPKAFPLSKYVTLDLERCIQCGRCVRFTEEISGDAQLALRFRGAATQPGTFELREFTSKFSGNTIEICPVGALTNRTYRFRARPWDLQTKPGLCTECGVGCNVHVDYRAGRLVRINGRTNEAVNEEWTCDRGKFGHGYVESDKRLQKVLVRQGDALVAGEWSDAYAQMLAAFKKGPVAGLVGGRRSNEDLYLLKRLFNELPESTLEHRFEAHAPKFQPDHAAYPIASYEAASSVLVFGCSPSDETPVLYLRLRKAWFQNGTKFVVAHHAETDVDSFAEVILRYRSGTAGFLAQGLAGQMGLESVSEKTGIPLGRLNDALEVLKGSPVITTRGLFEEPDGEKAVEALKSLGGPVSVYGRTATDEAAALLGVTSSKSAKEILEECASGKVGTLWLVDVDPFKVGLDRALVEKALEKVDFLVVQGIEETEAMAYASVVLPTGTPQEVDGSYTNIERRVQRFLRVLEPKGDTKPSWRVFSELSLRMTGRQPFISPRDVLARIGEEIPAFAGVEWGNIEGEGFVLGKGPDVADDPFPPAVVNG
ncbi:NADH dehydrogenase (quinone) subunit G [bacterium]|nr:MAG: NADH dehydrogenase (quinone) subunit G [bacterium]